MCFMQQPFKNVVGNILENVERMLKMMMGMMGNGDGECARRILFSSQMRRLNSLVCICSECFGEFG